MARRTPTQSRRQQQKNNRVIKTATAMIVNKIRTIIIGTKKRFRKLSPYYNPYKSSAKNKAYFILDTVFKVQSPWCHCLQNTSPIAFSL